MAEIEVIYNDGMFGFVSPLELDLLIESGEVVRFLRRALGCIWELTRRGRWQMLRLLGEKVTI